MTRIRLLPAWVGLSLLGISCGGSGSAESKQAVSVASCAEGTPVGERVLVRGDEVPMLVAPAATASSVINQRATSVMGTTQYRTLNSDYGLLGLCRVPGYVQVKIIEADGNPVEWETGWIEERYLRKELTAEENAGLYWNVAADSSLSEVEKESVKQAALRVLREDPNCQRIVDGARSTTRPGKFYVTCKGSRPGGTYNVWF
jgi:hypothetical protein